MSAIDLDYGALTIDTCIFDNHGITLEKGLFKQLDQFSGSPVKLVFADVIYHELLAHLTKKTKEARDKVTQGLRASLAQQLSDQTQNDNARALLFGLGDDAEIARNRLTAFYANTGAETVSAEKYANVATLIHLYFQAKSPFDTAGEKKYEFPDALALLSIEAWAKENSTKVLAVSADIGWRKFAETSDYIDVVENLGDAISHFQPHNAARNIIAELSLAVTQGKSNSILNAVVSAIENSLDGLDIYVEASSAYYFEEDDIYATYKKHEFIEESPGVPEINVIRIDADSLVLQLIASVICDVHCTFNLSVRDPVDKDYVSIGDNSLTQEEEYQTEILVTLSGDFTKGLESIEVDDIEILETIENVDFGDVEPDWSDD
ncbi:PIN domain-containing protein [Nitrosomonas sp.]|uniref:PIN domain-containing protein n=1 Tax=Nitrosomonas sp. TaxID=42353 RepID=UPI0025F824BF|nr:PIN domain-containing protein [Nitrosomonas sp.]